VSKADIASPEVQEGKRERGAASAVFSWFAGLAFYILILLVILGVYLFTAQSNSPRMLFGYSMFVVLTNSMQSQIPQASLVVVKNVDPNTIVKGDDITFLVSSAVTVTHQVVNIYEDYQQSGMRGFQTQGVDNEAPDPAVVYADNVIGKVIFHNETLGLFLSWVKARIWLVAGLMAVLIALIAVVRYLLNMEKEPAAPPETPAQEAPGREAAAPEPPDAEPSAPEPPDSKPPDPGAFDPDTFELENFDPDAFNEEAPEPDPAAKP